jgi:FHA domain-containing protein
MGTVDTGELAAKARNLAREQFVAQHPHLYLVIAEHADQLPIGFETAVVSNFRGTLKPSPAAPDLEIIEISKAPGNPYPDRISVGRARNCDVVLRDPSVSKLHAHLRLREGGKLDLIDLESQNGTRINGRTLTAHAPEWVAPGDTLMFGAVSGKLVDSDALFDLLQK